MKHVPFKWSVRLGGVLVCVFLSGCTANIAGYSVGKKEYFQPHNFYQDSPWLPADLRRVAVLPVATGPDVSNETERQFNIQLRNSVTATEKFEVVQISPDQLKTWTGHRVWSVDAALPETFFERIRQETGCDGVIFGQVTVFRPYQPMVIGWKLNLVDARRPHIWWSSDLVFDAGNVAVANSAQKYSQENQNIGAPSSKSATVLLSPRQFGDYALAASLDTLQDREKNN